MGVSRQGSFHIWGKITSLDPWRPPFKMFLLEFIFFLIFIF